MTDARFSKRRRILDAVNNYFVEKEKADSLKAVDTFYQRAYSMVSSAKAREAFNIAAEPAKLRDEYGRNQAGARMLLARRLVEAGVAVRHDGLRRLGPARQRAERHPLAVARVRSGLMRR